MPHSNGIKDAKILLIEDSPTIRRFTTRLLQNQLGGLSVTACADGEEALQQLRQGQFCVMITDLQMPRLDGWELLRQAGAEGLLKHTAVLVFSSVVDLARGLDASNMHSLRALRKPASSEELIQALRYQLSNEVHEAASFSFGAGSSTMGWTHA